MFTGITKGVFPVISVEPHGAVLAYTVELPEALLTGLVPGASVAIDGVCQTVVCVEGPRVLFEAIAETLARTTLGTLRPGRRVSVERSVRVGDELGGHEVSGHVLCTGRIAERVEGNGLFDLSIEVPPPVMRYLFPKGFVAVDGSSLTMGQTEPSGRFWLHLIPETLRLTNLGEKRVGDQVNVEPDSRTMAIVEAVERVLKERQER